MYFRGLSAEIHLRHFNQADNSLTKDFLEKAVAGKQNNYEVFLPDPQLYFLHLVIYLENHESHDTSQLRLYTDLIILLSTFQDKILNQNLFEYSRPANIEKTLYEKLAILKIFG
jgi:flagellar biosynthesis regulator FlbT